MMRHSRVTTKDCLLSSFVRWTVSRHLHPRHECPQHFDRRLSSLSIGGLHRRKAVSKTLRMTKAAYIAGSELRLVPEGRTFASMTPTNEADHQAHRTRVSSSSPSQHSPPNRQLDPPSTSSDGEIAIWREGHISPHLDPEARSKELASTIKKWIESCSRIGVPPRRVPLRTHVRLCETLSLSAMTDLPREVFAVNVVFSRLMKANALDTQLILDLTTVFKVLSKQEKVGGIALSAGQTHGKQPSFCSGADLHDLERLSRPEQAEAFIRNLSGMCQAIRNTPCPVVAMIDGQCIGAGLEMAASCDIRIATTKSAFAMPEVLLGIPSVIEARLLCDIVGWSRARHLMLTGCSWDQAQASEAGLITEAFKTAEEMKAWNASFMKRVCHDPKPYLQQKKLMRSWEDLPMSAAIEAGVRSFSDAFADGPRPAIGQYVMEKRNRRIREIPPRQAGQTPEMQQDKGMSADHSTERTSSREDQPQ